MISSFDVRSKLITALFFRMHQENLSLLSFQHDSTSNTVLFNVHQCAKHEPSAVNSHFNSLEQRKYFLACAQLYASDDLRE